MADATPTARAVLPISALSGQTRRLVEQVRTTKGPLVITRNGRSEAVLLDAEAYEHGQRRLALMERIARGKRDVEQGRTHTQEEVEALLDEWFNGEE